jgi:2-oxoglutarate dehydrogenase E2 component (dihydrolipoamide succinyltransferase)
VASANNVPRFYSPLVLNIAQSEGISMSELENIPGTGQDGRVSKKDILQYVANKASGTAAVAAVATPAQTVAPIQNKEVAVATNVPATISNYSGNVEIIEMDRMRKLIAKHMVDSKQTSAHVTSFAECDVTNLVLWRERVKRDFEKREGEKITYTPLFIEAIVKSIKKYPWLSSSIDGDKIIIKKDLNIGMATALPNGNLIVPVIKNADQLNLTGLTKQVNGLANAARTGKLRPDDTTGGTFTLTNVGTFGSIMGTPIINQPQVAIMAVGAIKKRPVVIETPQGDSIAIRHMMYISLSYDHRIIDGSLGSTFLNAVCKELENFDTNRTI